MRYFVYLAAPTLKCVPSLISATLRAAQDRPFAVDPAVAHSVVTRLHSLDPAYADGDADHAALFARQARFEIRYFKTFQTRSVPVFPFMQAFSIVN